MEHASAVEQFVVQFPALAAWGLLALGTIAVVMAGAGGRLFLKRLDKQDVTMEGIKTLLETETSQLREMSHAQDKRLIALEEWRRFNEALNKRVGP